MSTKLIILLLHLLILTTAHLSPIHYTISRRGGSFEIQDIANLTHLLQEVQKIETRFAATTRVFEGNTVVRKPKHGHGTQAGTVLLGEVGRQGNWYATLELGEPSQRVEVDLDMLTGDFFLRTGTGEVGFEEGASRTYREFCVLFLGMGWDGANEGCRGLGTTPFFPYLSSTYGYFTSQYYRPYDTHFLRAL